LKQIFSGQYFTDPEDPDCTNCGLMILYATGGAIGHWEMTQYAGNAFSSLPTGNASLTVLHPCLLKSSLTFRGAISPDNCGDACTGDDLLSAAVCPSDGYIRFVRDDGETSWTAIEALSLKIVFQVFDGTENNETDQLVQLEAPNCLETVSF
jgi:hypothetical protein